MSALPAALAANPDLDTWVRIDAADTVTVFTGKAELGQGLVSALARVAADELDVAFERVRVRTADTDHPLDERITAGSLSMMSSGSALRQAAAEVRALLLERAAVALGVAAGELEVRDGTISAPGRSVTYWALAGGRPLARRAQGRVTPKAPAEHRVVGASSPRRSDLRAIVEGSARFVGDLAPEGVLHGRIVRAPSPGAVLLHAGDGIPGVVRNGSFLGVLAEREEQAVSAAALLRARSRWSSGPPLEGAASPSAWLRAQPDEAFLVVDGRPQGPAPAPDDTIEWTHVATYTRPYLMHGALGPSAALAHWDGERLEVSSHTQGAFVLREALALALGLDTSAIRVRHVIGPGCYGHNGADDVALDAALLAMAVPGRPVLVKWSREDEHRWEPYGPPAVVELRAVLDESGRISDWRHDAWGTTHRSRPMSGGAVNLLAGTELETPVAAPLPVPFLETEAGIHRNATPIYDLPRTAVVKHFVAKGPLRTSSLRSLGAHANVLAIESFMDELALRAGATPVEFRLAHLSDARAREVLLAAVELAGWDGEPGRGMGVGLARYKNSAAYAAVVVAVSVDDATAEIALERIAIAADCGEVVDPSGAASQLEGGALQSASWTLKEQVRFDETAVTSVDWETYPIMRFSEVPSVETVLLDRPGEPFLGVGEATQGPTAAAIANAVFDAVGVRMRGTPFTPARLREAALDIPE